MGVAPARVALMVPAEESTRLAVRADLTPKYREKIRLDVRFDTAAATLRAESVPVLERLAKEVIADTSAIIEIAGHTDVRRRRTSCSPARGRTSCATS